MAAVLCCGAASAQKPDVTFLSPTMVRVQWSVDGKDQDNATGVCIGKKKADNACVVVTDNKLHSSELSVEIGSHGALTFIDAKTGKQLLAEKSDSPRYAEPVVQERIVYDESTARMEETANGKVTVKDIVRRDTVGHSTLYRNSFAFDKEEGLYGLGAHMEDYMNLNGKTLYLTQHNMKVTVPVLMSTKGYGLLFDAGCAMKFEDGTIEYEAAKTLDYYFIKGDSWDDIIGQYRELTGNLPLLPRYAFGYIQSKERYVSSDDLMNTVREYRNRHIPLDMIVQDWNYWPEGWGYLKMNRKYYPDPKALADSIHAMNARLMVSIWPNPQYCPEERDFREKGFMLEHSVYDVFNPDARKYYWKYVNDEFFCNSFDAWWCDSSEPLDGDWNKMPLPINGKPYAWDDHERRWHLNKDILADCMGAERGCLYSLYHSQGIYENQRLATDRKRVLNLTRSGFAGQQRYATVVWNGDTHASWQSFKQQIPAGLNYMATGCPYWTVDVGSFFTGKDQRWFRQGEFPEGVKDDKYKEYYTRMFQWATFLPMLRSHGTDTPREIWQFGTPGTKYYDAILKMINLRYELLPYIYSMAARQTFGNYTMARMLAFDFASDKNVLDLKDEYMFGDMLVCPVTDANATSRKVYLPSGAEWTDYWTGNRFEGGKWIDAAAETDRLPLFVRGGSIIVKTAVAEYADAQIGKPLTVCVYPGRDAEFVFYEDSGDSYDYEKGEYLTIRLSWDNKHRRLTIGEQDGSFAGMAKERTITVKTPYGEKEVCYKGKKKSIKI